MKKLLFSALLAALSATLLATNPGLSFDRNGEFRILQLTDCHMKFETPEEHNKTLARIDHVIKEEHPDFIAITGDVVTGNRDTRSRMWHIVIDRLDSYGIPYAIVYGNHDAEGADDLPRPVMSGIIASGRNCVNELNSVGELADIRVPVKHSKGNGNAFDMYFLDSHDYPENMGFSEDVGSYAWFTFSQVEWLRHSCEESTAANGGRHVPSMAFFHIPLREYEDVCRDGSVIGIHGEDICCGPVNTGMFGAMFETGNMIGVFAGHDHDNNFIAIHRGIALAYGGFSGDDTTYNHLAHGLRIIVVKEGERNFTTWIHEEDDRIQFKAEYKDGQLNKVR